MKNLFCANPHFTKRTTAFLVLFLFSLLLASCGSMDPRNVDVELTKTPPKAKITSYTDALSDIGLMSEIYATGPLKIQSNPIGDNTGTAGATGGEIPRDITEIIKSSLNSIGGNIIYIPYDPAFLQNQMVTGYSNFENKIIPDVILSGGITEFDRGLETRGDNTDVSGGAELTGLPDYLPSKEVRLRYGDSGKSGLARITLDFNLLDFQTMTGISKMNTVNTMEVHKALAGKELGISLFGQSFGTKGSIKKVQGRHAAVRLLVELSMIQIVGKQLALPYWRLLGEDAQPDRVVAGAIAKFYYSLTPEEIISNAQEWLYLHGYDVPQHSVLDGATLTALKQFNPGFDMTSRAIDEETFVNLYLSIPIAQKTLGRRNQLMALFEQGGTQTEMAVEQAQPLEAQPVETYAAPQQEAPQAQEQVSQPAQEATPQAAPRKAKATHQNRKALIGRILSDDEW